ncbi:MAG: SIS domain-containing protein [Gemmatimonadetes bacterium]|nr:SIS domain-containing protein [Gemmatimonadota bacterium]
MSQAVVRTHLLELADLAALCASDLSAPIAEVAALVTAAVAGGGKLMFCGNGGSAADAQHLATEYVVRFRRQRGPLPALALTTDTSLLTAAANDYGFVHVFARQVAALGRPGDVLFLHSTSGESPNLWAAATAARAAGVTTVALLAHGGGALRLLVDHALVVPTDDTAHAQELHLAIGHVICDIVEQSMVAAARPAARESSTAAGEA